MSEWELERLQLLQENSQLRIKNKFLLERVGYLREDVEARWTQLIAERDHFKAMLRERAEELVEARAEIERLRDDVERFRWANEMGCENTPNPSCQCSGCETARERADQGETGP